ncbi:MAG: electron transfer flavoprotein subunit alpha/FixB family protein [Chloroflexi bacterium]|nr:electron transfer flavoprotein subunit alpha/FixB family protein [Chloroflexota bacterium]
MIQPLYPAEEARGLWVYLECAAGQLEGVSIELLGRARALADQLGVELTGVLVGWQVAEAARQAIAHGADVVLLAEDERLARYSTQPYTRVVAEAAVAHKPSILLLGATPDGRDVAGRLAVRLRTGLTADCTGLELEPETGLLLGQTTGFGGGVLATIKCPLHRPQMATVRPGIFPRPEPDPARAGRIEALAVTLDPADLEVEVLERVIEPQIDLTRARALVIGGRGVMGDFSLLKQLAAELGAEIAGTRVVVDEGWLGRERQIGQTGIVTRPDLAVVCGASGAMQFTVGIKEAGTIVAINTDPEAPIFEDADYCVVDDFKRVLPPLLDQLRGARPATPARG